LIDNLISCGRYDEASIYLNVQLKQTYAYFKIPALYFAAQVETLQKKNSGKAKELLKECIALSSKTNLCQDVAQKAEAYLSNIK
ncbi:MAG: hypothetical protein EBU52_22305, partial [Cytophagia bacterium]|nr:hypothetical protein [Cytophagia bacterium]